MTNFVNRLMKWRQFWLVLGGANLVIGTDWLRDGVWDLGAVCVTSAVLVIYLAWPVPSRGAL
jgi:hypothetical protein